MLKERSYLGKSALQAMTFLIAKTISNKVWGLCLPRKLARVSFSRKKKTKSCVDRVIDGRHFTTSLKKSFAAICFEFSLLSGDVFLILSLRKELCLELAKYTEIILRQLVETNKIYQLL